MKYLKTIQRELASLLIIGILSAGISASANVIKATYDDQNITKAQKQKQAHIAMSLHTHLKQ